jgi:uncharacterized UPF0160 family protein
MKTVVTHGDVFHADEIMAIAILKVLSPDIGIERRAVTEEDLIDPGTVVIDTGRVYNPKNNNYDHHQFLDSREDFHRFNELAKRCSAGLIWKHFGKSVVKQLAENYKLTLATEQITKIWKIIDIDIIEQIDANDLGIRTLATNSKLSILSFVYKAEDRRDDKEFQKIVTLFYKFIQNGILNEIRRLDFINKLNERKFTETFPNFISLTKKDYFSTSAISSTKKYQGVVINLGKSQYKIVVVDPDLKLKVEMLPPFPGVTRYMATLNVVSAKTVTEVLTHLCAL